jgi:hypothetical protein
MSEGKNQTNLATRKQEQKDRLPIDKKVRKREKIFDDAIEAIFEMILSF